MDNLWFSTDNVGNRHCGIALDSQRSRISQNCLVAANEGESFLDWSYTNGFEVTEIGLHPLEQAHAAACELWVGVYEQALNKYN